MQMKRSRLAIATFLLAGSCLSLPLHAEDSCSECLQKALTKFNDCTASAKTEAEKSACNKEANKDNAACQQIDLCKKPTRPSSKKGTPATSVAPAASGAPASPAAPASSVAPTASK